MRRPIPATPLLLFVALSAWQIDNVRGPLDRSQVTIMPNRNQQRARPCLTNARGRQTTDILPHTDRVRLYQSLCADPVLVVGLLRNSNIGYLSELGDGWKAFRHDQPDESQRVVEIAQRMGIAEKPEKRRCRPRNL